MHERYKPTLGPRVERTWDFHNCLAYGQPGCDPHLDSEGMSPADDDILELIVTRSRRLKSSPYRLIKRADGDNLCHIPLPSQHREGRDYVIGHPCPEIEIKPQSEIEKEYFAGYKLDQNVLNLAEQISEGGITVLSSTAAQYAHWVLPTWKRIGLNLNRLNPEFMAFLRWPKIAVETSDGIKSVDNRPALYKVATLWELQQAYGANKHYDDDLMIAMEIVTHLPRTSVGLTITQENGLPQLSERGLKLWGSLTSEQRSRLEFDVINKKVNSQPSHRQTGGYGGFILR